MDYITINKDFKIEIEIKKSLFIASLFPAENEEQAGLILEKVRKEHFKATHNTYAYVIGKSSSVKKSSDDGEPSSTAGRPILQVIENNNLTNVILIVTRYFGGIKLGASGLVRAYSGAASEVIKSAELIKKTECVNIELKYEYTLHGKIEAFLNSGGFSLGKCDFAEGIAREVFVPIWDKDSFIKEVISLTNAKIEIEEKGILYIDFLCS